MIDSLTRHPTGAVFEADLCVIGGGPVGIAIAREFVDGGIRVLMLESGGERPDEATLSLNRGAVVGGPFTTIEDGRVRALGGTTWKWSGRCLPLDAEALERRPWVPATGWPFGAEELDEYTERAAGFFGIRDPRFAGDVWSEFGVTQPMFDTEVLIAKNTIFAQPLNSGHAHLKAIRRSSSVTTTLHATVVRIVLSETGEHVEQVEVAGLDGARARVRARAFVLCCGAIENARLLLLTPEIAKRHTTIGRFLQNHPRASCARLEPIDRRTVQDQFTMFFRRGRRRYWPRLALSPQRQRAEKVLASHANIRWTRPRSIRDLAAAGLRRVRGLASAPRSGEMWLIVDSEQAPNRYSRVSLGRDRDVMGLPQPVIDWRLGELERRTMLAMVEAVSTEFNRLGLAEVQPAAWLDQPGTWTKHVSDAAHHMGTTRIATTAAEGVVDEDCRVHGVTNLFVAGSSVFPASGAANPTLGAVALALRLADHIKSGVIRT